ncbi:Coatomer subunit delta, partial [Rhizoclosmatium hyalinum]
MPRARIEGLLASFPKLIGSSDQHTFVETDAVRYVYQVHRMPRNEKPLLFMDYGGGSGGNLWTKRCE